MGMASTTSDSEKAEPLLSDTGSTDFLQFQPRPLLKRVFEWLKDRKFTLTFLVGAWIAIFVSASENVSHFTWQSWWTLGLTATALFFLMNNEPPDIVLLTLTVTLRLSGVVTDDQAFSGFRSDGIIAIGALFVVAKCLETSGAIEWMMAHFLWRTNSTGLQLIANFSTKLETLMICSRVNSIIPTIVPYMCRFTRIPHPCQHEQSFSCACRWRSSRAWSTTLPSSP
jgi:hypothetical protein